MTLVCAVWCLTGAAIHFHSYEEGHAWLLNALLYAFSPNDSRLCEKHGQ